MYKPLEILLFKKIIIIKTLMMIIQNIKEKINTRKSTNYKKNGLKF